MLTAAAQNFATLLGLRALLGFGQAVTEPVGREPAVRLLPHRATRARLLEPAGDGVHRLRAGHRARRRDRRRVRMARRVPRRRPAEHPRRVARVRAASSPRAATATGCTSTRTDAGRRGCVGRPSRVASAVRPGCRVFVVDMVRGLRDDFSTIWQITTLRYALVGVSSLMFTVAGIGAWLPQFHERFSGMTEKQATSAVGALIILGGIPGVLLGGRLADRLRDAHQGRARRDPRVLHLRRQHVPHHARTSPSRRGARSGCSSSASSRSRWRSPRCARAWPTPCPRISAAPGFGAFNLVSILFGAAAAPLIVGALADVWNLRVAFLIVSPPVYIGAWILYLARRPPRRRHDEDLPGRSARDAAGRGALGGIGAARP